MLRGAYKMKIQVTIDQNGYITNYGVVNYATDENGNDTCTFQFPDGIIIELSEDLNAFDKKFKSYRFNNGTLIFDENANNVEDNIRGVSLEDLISISNDIINENE